MYHEAHSEFQIAAQPRAASSGAFRCAPQPRPRISLVTHHPLPQKRLASEASLIAPASQILIVTPRLEFPANTTKQTLSPISNRYIMPFLRLDKAVSSSFQPLVSSLQNLIENARLKPELSSSDPSRLQISNRERIGVPAPQHSANPVRHQSRLRISKPPISHLPTARRIRDTSADIPSLRAFLRCYASCGSRRKSE